MWINYAIACMCVRKKDKILLESRHKHLVEAATLQWAENMNSSSGAFILMQSHSWKLAYNLCSVCFLHAFVESMLRFKCVGLILPAENN